LQISGLARALAFARMIPIANLAVAFVFAALLPGLPASGAESAFTVVTNQFAGPPLVGYGAQISPYLTAPNQDQPVGDLGDLFSDSGLQTSGSAVP
jgi:hypothetical protein